KARRPTTTPPSGSTSTRGPAKKSAARWPLRRLDSPFADAHPRSRANGSVGRGEVPMPSIMLPAAAGVGLRSPHVSEVLASRPRVPFFEVHSENYYVDGGPALAALSRIRADYPLSLHGVGMS